MNKPEVNPKRTGVKAKTVVFTADDFCDYAEPGSVQIKHDDCNGHYMVNACPGCGRVQAMHIGHPKPSDSPSWDITIGSVNDVTTMTLSPSINCIGCCKWHGHLRNGIFESC
jgi:hypothetical protein